MKIKKISNNTADYDKFYSYDQDRINGFSPDIINNMLHLTNPSQSKNVLDAMAGNGNLTMQLYRYCDRNGIDFPKTVVLELSHVQCESARRKLADIPAKIIWGDILTMEDLEEEKRLSANSFDRIMIKSGNHEIPLEKQSDLYRNIFQMLEPSGLFVNLGFIFDDVEERNQFQELTRFKDSFAGMHNAVRNRHFLTRDELYSRLQEVGFEDIRCGMHFQYTIHSSVVVQEYFPEDEREYAHAEIQAHQAKAMTLRRKGRIHFYGDNSVMVCPGEITVARRPS